VLESVELNAGAAFCVSLWWATDFRASMKRFVGYWRAGIIGNRSGTGREQNIEEVRIEELLDVRESDNLRRGGSKMHGHFHKSSTRMNPAEPGQDGRKIIL
jgi:hypothetical protein